MSAIAGVFRFDDGRLDPALADAIDAGISRYGPTASGRHSESRLLMLHRTLAITPEDVGDVQPYISAKGHVLTWDGRLDNRRDLLCRLSERLPAAISDAALVAACYDAQGEAMLASLVGDWSLALWDVSDQRLLLASDYAANRAVYYAIEPRAVHWSTSLSEIVSRLSRAADLDDASLGDFLTFLPPGELTPYRGIRSVPAAHVLSWTRSGEHRRRRFWDLSIGTIRYKRPEEYGDHLLHLFADAVRPRIRCIAPVYAELSGGLDSTSIVCMADLCRRDEPGSCPDLVSVSYIADEERFIREVEAWRGKAGIHLTTTAATPAGAPDDDEVRAGIVPRDQRSNRLWRLCDAVGQTGGRVLLTGQGGDSIMGNYVVYPDGIAEALTGGGMLTALATARRHALATQDTMWRVMRSVASLYMPSRIGGHHTQRALLRRLMGNRAKAGAGSLMSAARDTLLATEPVARRWLDAIAAQDARVRAIAPPSRRTLVGDILVWADDQRLRTPEFWAGYRTHPFMHRPLVEYALAIPSEVLCPPGDPRALMRSTFGFVPPRIRARFSKGTPEPHLLRELRAEASAWLPGVERMQLVSRGLIDPTRLRARLKQIAQGGAGSAGNVALILETERWLRRRRTRSDYAAGARVPAADTDRAHAIDTLMECSI